MRNFDTGSRLASVVLSCTIVLSFVGCLTGNSQLTNFKETLENGVSVELVPTVIDNIQCFRRIRLLDKEGKELRSELLHPIVALASDVRFFTSEHSVIVTIPTQGSSVRIDGHTIDWENEVIETGLQFTHAFEVGKVDNSEIPQVIEECVKTLSSAVREELVSKILAVEFNAESKPVLWNRLSELPNLSVVRANNGISVDQASALNNLKRAKKIVLYLNFDENKARNFEALKELTNIGGIVLPVSVAAEVVIELRKELKDVNIVMNKELD